MVRDDVIAPASATPFITSDLRSDFAIAYSNIVRSTSTMGKCSKSGCIRPTTWSHEGIDTFDSKMMRNKARTFATKSMLSPAENATFILSLFILPDQTRVNLYG